MTEAIASTPRPADAETLGSAFQVYESHLAALWRDNEQLRRRDANATAKLNALYDVLETPDGENVEARVKGWQTDLAAAKERIVRLQVALGIGPNDDPASSTPRMRDRLASVEPASALPAYGHLLLMTALARISPALQSLYKGVPSGIKTPDGDAWLSYVEEAQDDEGLPMRLVVVRREPGAYAHQEARIRVAQLESGFAAAIRENTAAKKRLEASRHAAPELREAAEAAVHESRKRGEEIQAEMERLRPLTVAPEAQEWRFSADLDAFALQGAAPCP